MIVIGNIQEGREWEERRNGETRKEELREKKGEGGMTKKESKEEKESNRKLSETIWKEERREEGNKRKE